MDALILVVLLCVVAWSVLHNLNSIILLRTPFHDAKLKAFDEQHKKLRKTRLYQQYFYISCKVVVMGLFAYLLY